MNYNDQISRRYSRLVILDWYRITDKGGNYRYYAKCKCECGASKNINIQSILCGKTTSCGCYAKERSAKNTIHGQSYGVEYKTYHRIKDRCNNVNGKNYNNYGAKGIKCLWGSFDEFYKDMGKRPEGKTSIDRIDSKGNYCKENCRWADATQQTRNTSRSMYWIVGGVTYESRRDATAKTGFSQKKLNKIATKIKKYN